MLAYVRSIAYAARLGATLCTGLAAALILASAAGTKGVRMDGSQGHDDQGVNFNDPEEVYAYLETHGSILESGTIDVSIETRPPTTHLSEFQIFDRVYRKTDAVPNIAKRYALDAVENAQLEPAFEASRLAIHSFGDSEAHLYLIPCSTTSFVYVVTVSDSSVIAAGIDGIPDGFAVHIAYPDSKSVLIYGFARKRVTSIALDSDLLPDAAMNENVFMAEVRVRSVSQRLLTLTYIDGASDILAFG